MNKLLKMAALTILILSLTFLLSCSGINGKQTVYITSARIISLTHSPLLDRITVLYEVKSSAVNDLRHVHVEVYANDVLRESVYIACVENPSSIIRWMSFQPWGASQYFVRIEAIAEDVYGDKSLFYRSDLALIELPIQSYFIIKE